MGQAAADQLSSEELRRQIEVQRSALGRDLEVLGDRVSPGRMVDRRKEAVRSSLRGAKERVMGVADSATSRVSDPTSSIADGAGSLTDRIGSAPAAARSAASEGNPLAVGLIAFGAGAVLASLLPASDRERQLAQQATPTLERAAESVGSMARDEAEQLRPLAEQAVEEVRSTAQGAAEELKSTGQQAADEVRTTASS